MATLNRLTVRGAAAIDKPGRHADGGNLYLNISKSGARSWVFFYKRDGKQREMGLGPAGPGGVSLADARVAAAAQRTLLTQGLDPLEARATAKAEAKAKAEGRVTFGEFAAAYVEMHEPHWKNDKHAAQWRSTILGPQGALTTKRKAMPNYCAAIRDRPIADIDTTDVLNVIKPWWGVKRETASRIRQRIEAILDAATVQKARPAGLNPARWKGHLALLLPKLGKSGGHFGAMPWAEVPDFMSALSDRSGVAARALEFAILCASRSGEVRGATWAEVDLEAGVWTITAERMKAGKQHRVPLSQRAVEAAQTMLPLRPRREEEIAGSLVFPGLRRRPLSDMTLAAILKRMEIDGATVHGFRSSFRDWAAEESSAPFEIVEAALAHQIGNETTRAYLRGDLFQKRRDLMDEWANFILPISRVEP